MWRTALLLIILTGFPGMASLAQNSAENHASDAPLRIEIPARSVNETYRIIPCGANGLIMFYRSQEAADDSRTNWIFTCYDTNLQQIWVKRVPLINDLDYRMYQPGDDTLALLFVRGPKSKNPDNSFGILRIIPKASTLIMNAGTVSNDGSINVFGVARSRAWLGVNTKGKAGEIVTIRLKEGITRTFPLGVGDQIGVLWIKPDTSTFTLSAMVFRQISKKSTEYYLVRYDTTGSIRSEVVIGTEGADRNLTQVKVTGSNTGSGLLLGTYGQGLSRSNQKNKLVEESTGLFASQVRNGAQKSIRFYNFLELQNAASLVGENEMQELQKKALKKQKPITDYSLDYAVLMHDIMVLNDQYIVTCELFAPQYHTENFTDFDFYGRPYTNSYSVFDGYRFFNAIVAGFDFDGNLLWDNNIEIRNLVSSDLSSKVVTYPSGNDLVLCYISDGKIGSKIIRGNKVVEKLDFSSMDLMLPDDKLIAESKGMLVSWYGNYFLGYGYQEIKNIALDSNNKRLVFYFCKVRFDL